MKYFIIGLHSSGKQEIVDNLEKLGINCGKLFSNIEKPSTNIYNSYNYELYTSKDVNEVFENDAYIFIQEVPNYHSANYKCYEGLSKYTFDNNDVFVLSPDQFVNIAPNAIREEVCLIWVDNTKNYRKSLYHGEKRSYNFNERDLLEKRDMNAFVKYLYNFNNSNVIYFTDEIPERISTIIYTLIKHPELFDLYVKNFN